MKEINELEAMDIVDILFSDLYLYNTSLRCSPMSRPNNHKIKIELGSTLVQALVKSDNFPVEYAKDINFDSYY